MKKYKVWLYVELVDEENDFYEEVGERMKLTEVPTLEEAKIAVENIREMYDAYPEALDKDLGYIDRQNADALKELAKKNIPS